MPVTVAPYGSWQSTISADMVAAEGITLDQVVLDGEDAYWVGQRPADL